ncbi:hypothetical protein [Pseudarthrobacter sp. PS3-L1]|uniref:hypothetical protein n=1 Tax=Pseudarthrobacter sp. PS3-L1 TaxID=3046207 RepID=UPI0024B88E0B|nr:hypothetical protein [Pseudarthrobacter sp. PS3-L1]MDJ0320444.1 hypothetical protein [Pseudarthrobacter sp. PS3-L1]
MTRSVSSQPNRFTDDAEATAPTAGCQSVLEGKFRLIFDEAPRHDQVSAHPLGALFLKSLNLVLGGAVQFFARYIVVNIGRTFAIGSVRAPKVLCVRNPNRLLGFLGSIPAITTIRAATLATLATTTVTITEGPTLTLTLTGRTITIRLTLATLATTAITITEGPTLTLTLTGRTITIRLTLATTAITITVRLTLTTLATTTVTITVRLTLATLATTTVTITEGPTLALALTGRTI